MTTKQTSIKPWLPVLIWMLLITTIAYGQNSDVGAIPQKTYSLFGKDGDQTRETTARPVVSVPPLCSKKMKGNLPLPFGSGIMFSYYKQYYDAAHLMLTNDSIGFVATGQANVQQSTVEKTQMTFRPDVWVLPFLNIYGMVGYSRVKTTPWFEIPQVTIKDIPNIGDIVIDTTIQIKDDLILMAPIYGGGATVSTGYKSFFLLADYHYTITLANDMIEPLETHEFSVKAGFLAGKNAGKVKGSVWLGAMFVDDGQAFSGEIEVKEILPVLEILFGKTATYSGELTPQKKWNLVTGFSVMINQHHLLAFEAGYFKREQFSVFYGFRF